MFPMGFFLSFIDALFKAFEPEAFHRKKLRIYFRKNNTVKTLVSQEKKINIFTSFQTNDVLHVRQV